MSYRKNLWAALLFVPLALLPTACKDKTNDRDALKKEELDRDLNMALQKDSAPATFKDTAIGVSPAPNAQTPPQPAASPQPAPRQPPRQTPPPRRPQPRPERPRREETPSRVADAPAPAPRPSSASISSGTTFAIHLDDELSTNKNHPGDAFTATLREALLAADGTVIVPAGAQVRGRVTASTPSGHVGEAGVLRLAFESISYGGRSYPMQATVLEAAPQARARQSIGQQAGKIGAGAAIGAIAGRILGGGARGTITGAVVGGAAGTAIAMGTSDVDAVLPAGSRILVRVDTPIEVRTDTP
jgi:hypothetical protein